MKHRAVHASTSKTVTGYAVVVSVQIVIAYQGKNSLKGDTFAYLVLLQVHSKSVMCCLYFYLSLSMEEALALNLLQLENNLVRCSVGTKGDSDSLSPGCGARCCLSDFVS